MPAVRSWLLTDAAAGMRIGSFDVAAGDVPGTPAGWSVRTRTFRGGLGEGVGAVEVHNGALAFTVLSTRGMGLWRGDYRGTYLGWHAPVVGPVHPQFVNLTERDGLGWLNGFDEWLCRCGLAWNGPPGVDDGQTLTLHGRIANRPAHRVEVAVQTEPPFALSVSGQVDEAGLFGPRLRLNATYTTSAGSNQLTVRDVVENLGGRPAEVQMLYHLNLGPPLLGAGSRVAVPVRELAPLTARAAEGVADYATYAAPQAGYAEQVYAVVPAADERERTAALLSSPAGDRALLLRWNVRELPCFTIWKNTAAEADGYVTGLEPATNYPNFRAFERSQGRVLTLPPGGRWECSLSVELFDSAAEVEARRREVAALERAAPVVHAKPQARFSRT